MANRTSKLFQPSLVARDEKLGIRVPVSSLVNHALALKAAGFFGDEAVSSITTTREVVMVENEIGEMVPKVGKTGIVSRRVTKAWKARLGVYQASFQASLEADAKEIIEANPSAYESMLAGAEVDNILVAGT